MYTPLRLYSTPLKRFQLTWFTRLSTPSTVYLPLPLIRWLSATQASSLILTLVDKDACHGTGIRFHSGIHSTFPTYFPTHLACASYEMSAKRLHQALLTLPLIPAASYSDVRITAHTAFSITNASQELRTHALIPSILRHSYLRNNVPLLHIYHTADNQIRISNIAGGPGCIHRANCF